jgi:uncharacterized protein YceK
MISTLCLILLMMGCGSVYNLTQGPQVYGGTRYDWHMFSDSDLESGTFAFYDLPFSFILDTALLPITGIFELLRWITGWPVAHEY